MNRRCFFFALSATLMAIAALCLQLGVVVSHGAKGGTKQADETSKDARGLIARVRILEQELEKLRRDNAALSRRLDTESARLSGSQDKAVDKLDRALGSLAKTLTVKSAVRDYFFTADRNQHLRPGAGHGPWLSGSFIYIPVNQQATYVLPERFGSEVISATLVPISLEPSGLAAFVVASVDVEKPNQIKIWGQRKDPPWGLWVRVVVLYRE
jgi:hypothetical protein